MSNKTTTPEEKMDGAVTHAQLQVDLWTRCVELNTQYPKGSKIALDDQTEYTTESEFYVCGNSVMVQTKGNKRITIS